jgi:hypothetical protein
LACHAPGTQGNGGTGRRGSKIAGDASKLQAEPGTTLRKRTTCSFFGQLVGFCSHVWSFGSQKRNKSNAENAKMKQIAQLFFICSKSELT